MTRTRERPGTGQSPSQSAGVDRPAAVRAALRSLVARNGFHGASMSAVAREAGVATGTAYVHYASKDALVTAAYRETKRQLGAAAVVGIDEGASAENRFLALWLGAYRHLAADPEQARFMVQVDGSPYWDIAHEDGMEEEADDPLIAAAAAPDLAGRLLPLPLEVLYELGLGPAVRLAASGRKIPNAELKQIAAACWRAITRPE